jgi:hypothetical protein
MTPTTHGGARPGAGRPMSPARRLREAAPQLLEVAQTILLRLDLEAAEHPGQPFPCAALCADLRAAIAMNQPNHVLTVRWVLPDKSMSGQITRQCENLSDAPIEILNALALVPRAAYLDITITITPYEEETR